MTTTPGDGATPAPSSIGAHDGGSKHARPGARAGGSSRRPRARQHGGGRRANTPRSGGHTSLETAADAFRLLTTGPAPLALDGVAVGYGLPRRVIPLGELQAMLVHPSTSRTTRDATWRRVITHARTEGSAWVIGAVGLALPALWKMAGDLADGYDGEIEDLHSALVTAFVAGLHRIDAGRPGVITRLRWATYRAGLLARYTRDGIPPAPTSRPASAPPPHPWEHPDLLLADAVAKRVLSPLQAELIGRSRLEDIHLKDAAAELGVRVQAAYKARKRGEARLVAAIACGDVENRVSNPGIESGLFLTGTPAPPPRPPGPKPGDRRGRGGGKPAGVRGVSAESDGTFDPDSADEKGVFRTPARQPSPPSSPPIGQARPLRSRGRRRGHDPGGTS